jgi:hypothetical protein
MNRRINSLLQKIPVERIAEEHPELCYYYRYFLNNGFRAARHEYRWREVRKSFGDRNPEITFYIIRWDSPQSALMGLVLYVLGKISYAIAHGYVPVVDFKNGKNYYLRPDEIGKVNVWELFFEQPSGISLEEAYESRNVILGDLRPTNQPTPTRTLLDNEEGVLDEWRSLRKNYIRVNPQIRIMLAEKTYKHLPDSGRIIGVKCRGTDYTALKLPGHAIQPDIYDVIQKAKVLMRESGYTHVFLSTEDPLIIKNFQTEFQSQLIITEGDQPCYSGEGLLNTTNQYQDGLQYLITILILSQLPCIIGGLNGGSFAALLFADNPEYTFIWQLGYYGNEPD